jgi:hypothetical protein
MKTALSVLLVAIVLTGNAALTQERLAAIPVPIAIRPTMLAACQAWARHLEELIDQHRWAGEMTDEELNKATDQFYAAKSFCSMGKLLESLAMFERISIGSVKEKPTHRPLW